MVEEALEEVALDSERSRKAHKCSPSSDFFEAVSLTKLKNLVSAKLSFINEVTEREEEEETFRQAELACNKFNIQDFAAEIPEEISLSNLELME